MTKFLLAAAILLTASLALAAGSGGGRLPAAVTTPSEEAAAGHYRSGLRYKQRAWRQEQKAAAADSLEQRARLLGRAASNYQKAVDQQLLAVRSDPAHHEAANELGYGLRKLGRYREAIQWYDRALEIEPDFMEAIEYRGEACLQSGDLEGASSAYMTLFRNDPRLAGQLLGAMQTWLDGPTREGVDSGRLARFAQWVAERKALAELSAGSTPGEPRPW